MTPQSALDIVAYFEGLHRAVYVSQALMAVPYICPAGFWTIGYGHLCGKEHPAITKEQAMAYLESDMAKATAATIRHCPILLGEPEYRLAAIASFTFNLGAGRLQASTLRRRINHGEWEEAGMELLKWVNGGGKRLPGLVVRREAERLLFLTGKWT